MNDFFFTQKLTVGYDKKPLVRDIEIRLQKGRILTLIGPNGSGKSTILKTITKYLSSIAGTIYIDGRSIGELTNRDLAERVSVVLTQRVKAELLTCREAVETGRYPYTGKLGILGDEDKKQVKKAMELVHVTDLADRDFFAVSDGQRQRVLLARAICQEPEIIVLDEPTSFLDIRYELELLTILRTMAKERGIAVVMSLHELDLAQRVSDDVLCVKGETIAHYGTAREIFRKDLIESLYDLTEGSYNPLFGSLEMRRAKGRPEVFVIAGGGTGVETYRELQKNRIAFATGILHENDVDYQVAKEIANQVIAEKAFERISDQTFQRAVECMRASGTVLNCLTGYGEMNERNRELFRLAAQMKIPVIKTCESLRVSEQPADKTNAC